MACTNNIFEDSFIFAFFNMNQRGSQKAKKISMDYTMFFIFREHIIITNNAHPLSIIEATPKHRNRDAPEARNIQDLLVHSMVLEEKAKIAAI